MRLQIRVSSKDGNGTKKFELPENDEVVFGRANPDLKTDDQRLSRRHFKVALKNSCIEIVHLSKTNPTLMATDSEPEFKPVESKRTARKFCRVIAGSHKFLIELEGETSTELEPPGPTISSAGPDFAIPTGESAADSPLALDEEGLDSWIIEPIVEIPSSLIEEATAPGSELFGDGGNDFGQRSEGTTSPMKIPEPNLYGNSNEKPPRRKEIVSEDKNEYENDAGSVKADAKKVKKKSDKAVKDEQPAKPPAADSPAPSDKTTFQVEDDFFD